MSKIFDLKNEIEKYTSQLTSTIMSPRIKKKVKQEFADHIEDSVFRYTILGFGEKEAFIKVCEDMGDINKVKFLLSETHNNKLELFIVNKILKKLKKYSTSKVFFKTALITLSVFVIAVLGIIYSPLVRELMMEPIRIFILLFMEKEVQLRVWGYTFFAVCFFIIVFFLKNMLPFLLFVFGRLKYYIHIIIFCLFKKCKLHITRLPFSSLRGLNKKGDLKIVAGDKSYIVHFIDIVLKYDREFTILNDSDYAVAKALPDELRAYGATLVDGASWYNLYRSAIKSSAHGKDKIKSFPNIEPHCDIHVIIVHSNPISKAIIKKNALVPLGDGDRFGGFVNYSFKSFIRLLKREIQ